MSYNSESYFKQIKELSEKIGPGRAALQVMDDMRKHPDPRVREQMYHDGMSAVIKVEDFISKNEEEEDF